MQLPPAKILVVDDGPSNRKLLRLVLSRAGVDVTTADNGQVAVRLATDNPFDAVLMDMQMPVMDGYHATRELRRRGFAAPIIALTAHAMNGDEQQCRAAGCTGFLTKPLDIDRLLEVLAAILAPLGRSKPAAARSAASPSAPRQVDSGEIHSTLPTDDPEFCEIIHEFVELLHEELGQIKAAWRTRDFKQIARLAHNIKGAGGSAGFAELMPPAKRLELLAKAGQEEQFEAAIAQLQAVASRIALPPLSVASVG